MQAVEEPEVKKPKIRHCGSCRNTIPMGGVSVMCLKTCKLKKKSQTCKEHEPRN